MSQSLFLGLMQQTIFLILILSAPILIVALVVGIGISLMQSVTQIQESTLTFVPKILAGLGVLIILSPWMLNVFIDRTHKMFETMAVVTKQQD